ncbi:MAG: TrmJ/YjtD family RNA methyltransferase [Acidobacteria bacterium]|nr:TrmJ/YjtD family RNA methyltransferase [Acidobacteriota bacterium]
MLTIVLVHPRNPLNIGAAARAMSNFGFDDLRLVGPYDVAFREVKSAVGAGSVMQTARCFDSLSEAIADCTLVVGTTTGAHREGLQTMRRLESGGKLLARHKGRAALLFGSEKFGLSNDDLSHCQWLVQIPSREEHRSMNLGQAVAVCLYELIRDPKASDPRPVVGREATVEQTEALQARLAELLELSGHYDHTAVAGSERRLRALIKRMGLTKQDTVIWLGIYRQILWKIKSTIS